MLGSVQVLPIKHSRFVSGLYRQARLLFLRFNRLSATGILTILRCRFGIRLQIYFAMVISKRVPFLHTMVNVSRRDSLVIPVN